MWNICRTSDSCDYNSFLSSRQKNLIPLPSTSTYLIALLRSGSLWVAVTEHTTSSAGQFPVIRSTLVALEADHIRQTGALARAVVAGAAVAVGAQHVAYAA